MRNYQKCIKFDRFLLIFINNPVFSHVDMIFLFIFEQLLYGDEEDISLIDIEFVVDRIVELPKIRPH